MIAHKQVIVFNNYGRICKCSVQIVAIDNISTVCVKYVYFCKLNNTINTFKCLIIKDVHVLNIPFLKPEEVMTPPTAPHFGALTIMPAVLECYFYIASVM